MKDVVYLGYQWFGDEWEGEFSVVKVFKKESSAKDWVSEKEDDRTYTYTEVE